MRTLTLLSQGSQAMRVPKVFLGLFLLLLTGWGEPDLDWPYVGPMPDQPVAVPPAQYESILRGTRRFRPVEPMPWGDVNRRVTPQPPRDGANDGGTPSPPPMSMPGHGHH